MITSEQLEYASHYARLRFPSDRFLNQFCQLTDEVRIKFAFIFCHVVAFRIFKAGSLLLRKGHLGAGLAVTPCQDGS